MKVKLKVKEYLATLHAKHVAKNWEYFCLATESYLKGFQDSKPNGDIESEYTIEDGQHQLSVSSFKKWNEENKSKSFKEHLELNPYFNFTEIMTTEDENGTISFRGTCRRS